MKLIKDKIIVLQLISSVGKGGAEKLLIDLLKFTSKLPESKIGFFVVILNNFIDLDIIKELEGSGFKVYLFNRKQGHKHPKYIFKLLEILKSNNIDVIHSHDKGSRDLSMICKCFKPGLKLIYTAHCIKNTDKQNKIQLYLNKRFIDMNIAVSEAVLSNFIANGKTNVIKIYNGIEIEKFSSVKNKNNTKELENIRIINVARLNHLVKGQDVLIKALKVLKDRGINFSCSFIGGLHEYDKPSFEYLRKLIQDLGLEERIVFLGGRNDVPELLSQHDLFVLPSRFESFGLVILEAMAAGLPVIVSDNEGPMELIHHGKNGLVFERKTIWILQKKFYLPFKTRKK